MIRIIGAGCTGIVQTLGRVTRKAGPGPCIYVPLLQKVSLVSNRIYERRVQLPVRTLDKVIPVIDMAVFYQVEPQNTEKAFVVSGDPMGQLTSMVENAVRTQATTMTLDNLTEAQESICEIIQQRVSPGMSELGYTIKSVLVRDIAPPKAVADAMNEINRSLRMAEAAKYDAEALKITRVTEAQVDATRKELQGHGIAKMRNAIAAGWSSSVSTMAKELNMEPHDVCDFMLKVLELDTMGEAVAKAKGSTIFYPTGTTSGNRTGQNAQSVDAVRTGMLQAMAGTPKEA